MKPSFPWTKTKYQQWLADHDITQERAAAMLGMSRRASSRWANEMGPPFAACLVFQLMHDFELLPEDIEEIGEKLTDK
jgi:predicted transcriptional regulator